MSSMNGLLPLVQVVDAAEQRGEDGLARAGAAAPKKKAPTRSRVGDPELDATKRRLDFDDDDDDDAAEREGTRNARRRGRADDETLTRVDCANVDVVHPVGARSDRDVIGREGTLLRSLARADAISQNEQSS